MAELGELLDDVFRRSKGVTDQSQLTDFPLVFAPSNYHNSRVIVEDGRIVSHSALWQRELIVDGERLKAGVIVSVATHPHYRLRGHAAALMRDLQSTLRTQAYDLAMLWTSVPDFYRKLGWETVVPRGSIVTVNSRSVPAPIEGPYEFARFDPARHLDDVITLHELEPVRFARSRDEALKLLTLPKVDVWVATRDAHVVAFLVDAQAINKRGLIEYGGESDGIAALVGYVLKSHPATSDVQWMLYPTRPDLVRWADSINLPSRPLKSSKGFADEMILPVRPASISARVREQLFVWGLDWA